MDNFREKAAAALVEVEAQRVVTMALVRDALFARLPPDDALAVYTGVDHLLSEFGTTVSGVMSHFAVDTSQVLEQSTAALAENADEERRRRETPSPN